MKHTWFVSPPTNPHLKILFIAAMLLYVVLIECVMCIGYDTIKDNRKCCTSNSVVTYLLTPWSRVLLEKLTGFAANQEIPHIL